MREELKDLQEDLLSPQALRNRGFFDSNAVQNLRAANERGQIAATYTLLSMMSIEIWSRIFLDRSMTPSLGATRVTSARNHETIAAMA
jgi:asparagine synthase (glutamine-hydrolysing)